MEGMNGLGLWNRWGLHIPMLQRYLASKISLENTEGAEDEACVEELE